jgi:hypothetical protein
LIIIILNIDLNFDILKDYIGLEILGYILKSYSDFLKLEIGEIEI